MDRQEIEAMVVKLSMTAAAFKSLGDRIVSSTEQASQQMSQTAERLASVASQSAVRGAERLHETASKSITAGATSAVTDVLAQLGDGASRVDNLLRQLEQRTATIDRVHVATAWKGFIALALGGAAIIATAAYFAWNAHKAAEQANQQAKWISQVNAAEQNGKLAPCADGEGLCALIGKKLVRLDQP